jgi:hypothetical protein
MADAVALSTDDGRASPRPVRKRRIPKKMHAFFLCFASIFVLLVLAGFSRTFFIPVARGTFSRPLVVHIHLAFFFAWTVIFFVQTILAASGRLRTHRKVGSIAGWLIVPMLFLGTVVAARDTVHDFHAGDGAAALSLFYGELADLAMFGLLAGGAMLFRNKPEYHKRWVILSSLALLGAAVGRIPEIRAYGLAIYIGLIAAVAAYDIASRRAIHTATVIGATILLVLNLTQEPIGNTRSWIDFSHRLLHV